MYIIIPPTPLFIRSEIILESLSYLYKLLDWKLAGQADRVVSMIGSLILFAFTALCLSASLANLGATMQI